MIEQNEILNFIGNPKLALGIGIQLFIAIIVFYVFCLLNKIKSENLANNQFIYKEIILYSPVYLIAILINYFIPIIFFVIITIPLVLVFIAWILLPVLIEKGRDNFFLLNKIMHLVGILYWCLTLIFAFLRFG